jgi:hypothetical protein
MPGESLAWVTSMTIAIFGLRQAAQMSAPPPCHAISSCVVATATTRAFPGCFAYRRSASSAVNAPIRSSMDRDTRRLLGNSIVRESMTPGSPT